MAKRPKPRDGWENRLYFGDNLSWLRQIEDETIDLVYLDPPFNSKADYNILFENKSGDSSEAQTLAFKDTWEWDESAAEAYHELITSDRIPERVKTLMESLKVFLTGSTGRQGNSMMAYLTMMALRLAELHRVLKPTGSLYLHCDPTASHYLKLILDSTFGFKRFVADIAWKRSSAHSNTKQGRKGPEHTHDQILMYAKTESYTWNPIYTEYSEKYISDFYRHVDEDGRRYRKGDLTASRPGGDVSYEWRVKRPEGGEWIADLDAEHQLPKPDWEYKGVIPYKNRYWAYSQENLRKYALEDRLVYTSSGMPNYKRYLDEMPGVPLQDVWTDIPPIGAKAAERLGYPTQKPEALLERIIRASSNEGDLVLDPFCGCGTTIAVAERLNRRWMGVDITYLAVDLMERRLIDLYTPKRSIADLSDVPVQKRRKAMRAYWENGNDTLGINIETGLAPFEVVGDPNSVESAKYLWQNDPYQFEWWCIAMVGAQGKEHKRGADKGIDGVIRFTDRDPSAFKKAIVSVKGGRANVTQVRDLQGVVQDQGADCGILILLEEPTKQMSEFVANAGRWNSELHPDRSYPRLQILTVAEILDGDGPELPTWGLATHRKAKRREEDGGQMTLGG